MGCHRSYGLGAVEWRNGVAYDTNCPGRTPIRYSTSGAPIWGMTSSSGFAARPILNPDQIPCGQKQVDIRVTSVGKAIGDLPKVAAIAVGAVTAVALGKAALAKGMGALSKGAGVVSGSGTAATASASAVAEATAQTSGLFAQIKASGNKLLGFINQGRTINAIANGELPPPPISITGNSFTEWALAVAQDEMIKTHQRKMTRAEEEMLRLEIEAMQRDMARRVPENFPKSPSSEVPIQIQLKQAEMLQENKSDAETLQLALTIGIPILAMLIMKG
jgi:hypothetical protein